MFTEEENEKKWPNRLYLLHENEEWLEQLAGKGLKLKSCTKDYVYFDEAEPQKITYKFVILKEDGNPYKQIRILEHQGFTLVGNFQDYYIFCIDGRYSYTEPRLSEETIFYTKKWFNRQIINRLAGSVVSLILFVISAHMSGGGLLLWLVIMCSPFYCILFAAMVFLVFFSAVDEYHSIIKSKKFFLNHEKYVVNTNAFKLFLQDKAIFSPKQYEVYQYCASKYDASQEAYDESLAITYYEIIIEQGAGNLALDLIEEKSWAEKEEIKKMETAGLDVAYVRDEGGAIEVSANKGKRVMYACYLGDKTAEDLLREIAEVL